VIKEVGSLPDKERRRIVAAVEGLQEDPLKGTVLSTDWKGFRRLRVGDYRIIYAFDGAELLISVVRVGHRREVYR
jgi:mRNA interferase RelE/StbE